ncbi:MAG TPA: hypothetical protein VMU39_03385 [Solirubrobacteraceae bacterium]|nr:hypothetical protein [Solirubrobacteraceae bacterium]
MPLDKQKLKDDLIAIGKQAVEQQWDTPTSIGAMVDAIDAFVRSGDVVGVTVHRDTAEVLDSTQTGVGKVQ